MAMISKADEYILRLCFKGKGGQKLNFSSEENY